MFRQRVQLGLLHAAVAMTLVPINSTLNRVMIKELALSATLVAALASLPYLFSPIQVAIGSFSDRHPLFGLRRTPYIALGLLLCVAGVVTAPQAAFLLAEDFWAGIALGTLVFGAWGMGFNLASVSYLSLASELSGEARRSRTIAVMFFMMIAGIIVTAIGLSRLVDPYTPEAMARAFWIVGLAALALGGLGLAGLERRPTAESAPSGELPWGVIMRGILGNRQARLFFFYLLILLVAILGQDILLEPFAAEAFGMPVKTTTRISSIWGGCVLAALVVAGLLEGRAQKRAVARWGAWGALAGFVLIAASGIARSPGLFYSGVVLLGVGTGLSTVANLSLMLDMTTPGNVGLFMGAWGMANALSRLSGSVLSGAARDVITQAAQNSVAGYVAVFGIEAALLALSLLMLARLNIAEFRYQAYKHSLAERAALAGDA